LTVKLVVRLSDTSRSPMEILPPLLLMVRGVATDNRIVPVLKEIGALFDVTVVANPAVKSKFVPADAV